jgi:aryl sulfotransferase
MVHYADLTRDLEAEMHRVARFLDISVSRTVWPRLVAAATFATMKAQGESLMPNVVSLFEGGAERFFHKGENGRWRGVFSEADIKLYEAKLCSLPAACRHWLETGRLESGDPRLQ